MANREVPADRPGEDEAMTDPRPTRPDGWINEAATHLDDHVDVTEVVDRLSPRLRASVRSGVPIATGSPGVEINTRALRQILARAVHRACRREATAIDFVADNRSITQIRLEMVVHYGDSITEMSNRVREAVRTELTQLQIVTHGDVDVRWVDVDPPARVHTGPEAAPLPRSESRVDRL
jgi:uncharacterized alkaline shock family protein YloU